MSVIPILQYPDPRLRIRAKCVTDVHDPKIQKVIADMLETLQVTENCVGLAATQLAIDDPHQITVIDVSEGGQPICLINPEIIRQEGSIKAPEGCMSVCPNEVHADITRAAKIMVRALDREGKIMEIEATGLLCKCILHEVDHLQGKLYIDHLSRLKRQLMDHKINKIKRQK